MGKGEKERGGTKRKRTDTDDDDEDTLPLPEKKDQEDSSQTADISHNLIRAYLCSKCNMPNPENQICPS